SWRADLLSRLHQELDVEAEAATGAEHGLQRGEVDGVLPLVVGRAAAVDALTVARELPRLEPGAPLAFLPADHVAVGVAQHRRDLLVLDPLGDQERAVPAGRIGRDAAGESHALEAFGDLPL